MTERGSARLEARLATWFQAEVRRAERDLRDRPVAPVLVRAGSATARVGRSSPVGVGALAVVLAVAAILVGSVAGGRDTELARPSASMSTEPRATPDPALPSAVPPALGAPRRVVLGEDGLPTEIDGERVHRATEVAALPNSTDPVLIAGRLGRFIADCTNDASRPAEVLFSPCEGDLLLDERATDTIGGAMTGRIHIVRDRAWFPGAASLIALRAHRGDGRAAGCSDGLRDFCREAFVIDEVVWLPDAWFGERADDGIPGATLDRPSDSPTNHARTPIAGWIAHRCAPGTGDDGCGLETWFSSSPSIDPTSIRLAGRRAAGLPDGPAVLVLDATAARLGRAAERARQVHAVLWLGDGRPAAEPLGPTQVAAAVDAALPGSVGWTPTPWARSDECPETAVAGAWSLSGAIDGRVLVFRDRAAIETGGRPRERAAYCGFTLGYEAAPIVVENVVMWLDLGPTPGDPVSSVRAALEAAVEAGTWQPD